MDALILCAFLLSPATCPQINGAFKGDIGAEFAADAYAAKASIDTELTAAKAAATVAYEGFQLGGHVAYKFPGEKPAEVKDFNAGLAYGAGGSKLVALTTSNKMSAYHMGLLYRHQPNLAFAARLSSVPEKSSNSLEAGLLYGCNPHTNLRAKVSSAGVISGCVSQECAKKMTVAATTEVSAKDMAPKFGLSCTLG